MRILDFHNHYYPPEYIAAIREGPSAYRVSVDGDGNPVLHSPGDRNYIVPGHRDIEFRTQVLDEAGIDMQVLTFTAPGTLIEAPARSVELADRIDTPRSGRCRSTNRARARANSIAYETSWPCPV